MKRFWLRFNVCISLVFITYRRPRNAGAFFGFGFCQRGERPVCVTLHQSSLCRLALKAKRRDNHLIKAGEVIFLAHVSITCKFYGMRSLVLSSISWVCETCQVHRSFFRYRKLKPYECYDTWQWIVFFRKANII